MIKMIATDLDRTLLRDDKTISEYTTQTLIRCREMGIKLAFATARPLRTIRSYMELISPDAVIAHNGAVVYQGGGLLCSCGIDAETAKRLLLSLSHDWPTATLSAEIDDVMYANFDPSVVWDQEQAIRTDFTDLPDKPADKIIVGVSSMDEIRHIEKSLPDHLYVEMCEGNLGLIMRREATKLNAIQTLAKHFAIGLSDLAAFGDDINDLGMLRECGAGVAVANALDEVKASAGFMCDSNEQDGVAKWIEENIFRKSE